MSLCASDERVLYAPVVYLVKVMPSSKDTEAPEYWMYIVLGSWRRATGKLVADEAMRLETKCPSDLCAAQKRSDMDGRKRSGC